MPTRVERPRLVRSVAALRLRGRNARYRAIFDTLASLELGVVLDVGGGRVAEWGHDYDFDRWIVVEPDTSRFPATTDTRVSCVRADGAHLPLADATSDTTLSIQVLEHVFDPVGMVAEMVRVTRPGGVIVLVVPQTANVHELPHHYQNFTRYWLDEVAARFELEVVDYQAMGGAWSTIASRLVLQYATILRAPGHHDERTQRGARFWLLAPLGLVVTAVFVPLALLLGTNDIAEEANNHLMVLRRPIRPTSDAVEEPD